MKRRIIFWAILVLIGTSLLRPLPLEAKTLPWWEVQSIDTMKYSRDIAREKLKDTSFNTQIEDHVKKIADTGATHVAIATPYDEEFIPYLTRWVTAARKYDLNVWFRGNFSGWEGWFEYARINRDEHAKKTREFLEHHPTLFLDGDIFSPCPECENGGPGDPRNTQDVKGHREFLIKEYQLTQSQFQKMGKKVASNYASMNGDVARLIMDKPTTAALDGLVTIDHYVKTSDQLVKDIEEYAVRSGGKVVLGEWGAPIPDIHGAMSEADQAKWVSEALAKLSQVPDLVGLNYWTDKGSSTALWSDSGNPRSVVSDITKHYTPKLISGTVTNEIKKPIAGASIKGIHTSTLTDAFGHFELPISSQDAKFTVSASSYRSQVVSFSPNDTNLRVRLPYVREGLFFRIFKYFYHLINPV